MLFQINFKTSLLGIMKKALLRFWLEISLNVYINLEKIAIFVLLNFPIHEHGIFLHLFIYFVRWK